MHDGWINGGYFVVEPEFFDLIDGDSTLLEREPLEAATKAGELMAYQHEGFWQCMDTKRDHDLLESLWLKGAPWKC
jgi:glucose-1-phosphate cytidylyltransferase